MRRRRSAWLAAAAAFGVQVCFAQDPAQDVTEIDLDDLMNVRVTSPAKKEQPLTGVPAAVYVIRNDDLRRSGAKSIPEALRGVPGLQVARTQSRKWAVSSRGFNDNLSNKLLVLIDGRSVYSPIHSGVFWDVQDAFLEDVERIEVIRGPGGSLWGANAINGVINVITKKAGETRGGVLAAGAGTEERAFGGVRWGFEDEPGLDIRLFAKYNHYDDAASGLDPDRDAYDGGFLGRAGFRSDWKAGDRNHVSILGDFYDGQVKEDVAAPSLSSPTGVDAFRDRTDVRGGSVLLRWERELGKESSLTAQAYYDHTFRSTGLFDDGIQTGDLDLQHRFQPLDGHDVIWGAGYRVTRSDLRGTFPFHMTPERRSDDVVSAFLQDEIRLIRDRLRLVLGSKFEHNDYSGFEYQPSARLAWTPDERHMVWLAASRAVRTPSIFDFDGRLNPIVVPGAPPLVFSIRGNHEFRSEVLIAYEAGYRVRPAEILSLDLAGFYNRYDRLRSGEVGAFFVETDPAPPHLVIPVDLGNGLDAETWGVELAANFQMAPGWLLQASYSFLRLNASEDTAERRDPRHTLWARLAIDLPWNLSLDLLGRYVSSLPSFEVEAYAEADVRLAWRDPSRRFEAALVGQNLVHDSHAEFESETQRGEIERGVYLEATWRY